MEDTDAQGQPFWPELEELARPARERRRLPPDTRSAIILRLCGRAPLSVKELSLLLQRSEAYIGDAIRPLVAAGDLTFIYPDQPRHPRQKYVAAASTTVHPAPAPEAAIAPRPPQPAPRPAPTPAPTPPPAPSPAPAPRPPTAPATAPAPAPVDPPPRFPNSWTNLAYVIAIGALLGLTGTRMWFAIAALAAVSLSWLHIWTGSAQYRRFNMLQAAHERATAFVLLKSAVTLVEITVIYLVTAAYQSTP